MSLPRDSATAIATLGPGEAAWDQHAELLATIVDVQQWLLHAFTRVHFEGKPRPPQPFPRPGAPPPESQKVSTAHLDTVMKIARRS